MRLEALSEIAGMKCSVERICFIFILISVDMPSKYNKLKDIFLKSVFAMA